MWSPPKPAARNQLPQAAGPEDGEATEEHEAESHDGDGLDRVRASGHDAGAVEQQKGCGKGGLHSCAEQEKCQKGPGDKGRSKAEDDFARRP